jgi:hypothetical protein
MDFVLHPSQRDPRTRRDFQTDPSHLATALYAIEGRCGKEFFGTTGFRWHSARLFKLGGSVASKILELFIGIFSSHVLD